MEVARVSENQPQNTSLLVYLEYDYVTQRLSLFHGLDSIVNPCQRVPASDKLIQL
jgi:hypothetical protein